MCSSYGTRGFMACCRERGVLTASADRRSATEGPPQGKAGGTPRSRIRSKYLIPVTLCRVSASLPATTEEARACPSYARPWASAGSGNRSAGTSRTSRSATSTSIAPGAPSARATNTWFTLLTMNQHPLHFDKEYAAKSEFGRPLVNSCLTLSMVAGMSVSDLSQKTIANLGWDPDQALRPRLRGRHHLRGERDSGQAGVEVPPHPGHRDRPPPRAGRRTAPSSCPTSARS